ncbi:MAG TPA: flagellar export chaperone FliS [Syntrophales bacterium]|nr:flagellar export chaperone FliS [Syntrophales bacterium]HOM06871.1 flagellar export chaperone FliS [Syntrophales bacterium]HON99388.1 flagellar export chaperone FliS [Syntrophales bacterium]HPC00575.1 flagellar export chaperone FliS [Syntrophales bacterium]HPQ06412.1 flagellar export chaperone FliS [Syntrophales bacterium]
MYEDALNTYRRTTFFTAEPLKLVILCYKGAVNSLRLAKEAYERGEYETKAKALQKTLDIIHELDSSLDMKKGGAIAVNLRNLYHFMTKALIEADLKRDVKMFDRIASLLEELESAWEAAGRSLAAAGTEGDAAEERPRLDAGALRAAPVRAWNA